MHWNPRYYALDPAARMRFNAIETAVAEVAASDNPATKGPVVIDLPSGIITARWNEQRRHPLRSSDLYDLAENFGTGVVGLTDFSVDVEVREP